MQNINYFNEDDEISDEEYYKEDEISDDSEEDTETVLEDLAVEDTEVIDEYESDDEDDEIHTSIDEDYLPFFYNENNTKGAYKPKGFTQSFLRCECNIQLESYKTLCKFEYRGSVYTGRVLKRCSDTDYIFIVDKVINNKTDVAESGLKKIYIPDTKFISVVKDK